MKKIFYATPDLAYTSILCLGFGILLMSVPLLLDGSLIKILTNLVPIIGILLLLGFGLSRGTYITINEKELRGRVLFISGKKMLLSNIISIKKQGSFGGLITQIFIMYKNQDDSVSDRSLISKEMLKKEDLIDLIETIYTANPNIIIEEDLLNK